MTDRPNKLTVTNNDDASQYEATVEGQVAFAAYERRNDEIVFTHTEVPPALEGKGLASAIVRTALDDARAQGLSVVPLCPFVASYIRRHQEYLDLVSPAYRSRVTAS
jgi:uncharacterized protein